MLAPAKLFFPALSTAQLLVATAVLRREPATVRHRTAAGVVSLVGLLSILTSPPVVMPGKPVGLVLLAALSIPAAVTLTWLQQTSCRAAGGDHRGF